MGLESFFSRKPKQEKSPEQKKMDDRNNAALTGAALSAAVLAGVAYEAATDKTNLENHGMPASVSESAPATAHTMQGAPSDAPKPIVIPAPKSMSEQPLVINPDEHEVVIDLAEHIKVIDPETMVEH